MKALVLCDDYYHPAQVARSGLAPLEAQGWSFDWVEHAGGWSAARMDGYPVVILAKMNHVAATDTRPWLDDERQWAFPRYVRRGNALLVVHSGLAEYDQLPAMRGLLGGVFVQHPPQCAVTVAARAGHQLGAGCATFTVVDEHYVVELDDPQADIFLTTMSEHGAQPGGWARAEGAGRVCAITPGHNLEVWLHPSYQALLQRALSWCLGAAAD